MIVEVGQIWTLNNFKYKSLYVVTEIYENEATVIRFDNGNDYRQRMTLNHKNEPTYMGWQFVSQRKGCQKCLILN